MPASLQSISSGPWAGVTALRKDCAAAQERGLTQRPRSRADHLRHFEGPGLMDARVVKKRHQKWLYVTVATNLAWAGLLFALGPRPLRVAVPPADLHSLDESLACNRSSCASRGNATVSWSLALTRTDPSRGFLPGSTTPANNRWAAATAGGSTTGGQMHFPSQRPASHQLRAWCCIPVQWAVSGRACASSVIKSDDTTDLAPHLHRRREVGRQHSTAPGLLASRHAVTFLPSTRPLLQPATPGAAVGRLLPGAPQRAHGVAVHAVE